MPGETTLLDLLSESYLEAVDRSLSSPELPIENGDLLAELLYRLATTPRLPDRWERQLTLLAGPRMVVFMGHLRGDTSQRMSVINVIGHYEHDTQLRQEGQRLFGEVTKRAFRQTQEVPQASKLAVAVGQLAMAFGAGATSSLFAAFVYDQLKLKISAARASNDQAPLDAPASWRAQDGVDGASRWSGRILAVDASGNGQFRTITEAMRAAADGARIVVRPGHYEETILAIHSVQIVGLEPPEKTVVNGADRRVLSVIAGQARLANLTLYCHSAEAFGVRVDGGRLELGNCDVSKPQLSSIFVAGGTATVRRSRIHDNRHLAIAFYGNADGVLEGNDIYNNGYAGVEIAGTSNQMVQRNSIQGNRHCGIRVHAQGRGMLTDNEIVSNWRDGIRVEDSGSPTVRGNRIRYNVNVGINVVGGGGGVFEDNDLRGNRRGAWDISWDSRPNVRRSGNLE